MSAMMQLHTRSSLAELAALAHRWRCYDLRARHDQARFRDVVEINEHRARREASLVLRVSEEFIRVEPLASGLGGLGVA